MRVLVGAALAIGMGILLTPQGKGQPKEWVIQSKVSPNNDEPAKSKKNQQATQKKSIESTNPQAQEQQQRAQALNTSEDQKKEEIEIEREIGRYTGWLVLVGAVQFAALILQSIVFIKTLRQMQDTDRRQLRAYVLCESGMIFNVANPVPLFPGQNLPVTDAQITNLAVGPGVRIQTKNTGQTPAFQVRHWGYICFREYPLAAALPTRLPGTIPVASVLGAGIASTKLIWLPQPLTAQQISDLRAGTGAVYVYGEITYADAFSRQWVTKYRLMYRREGGAIGVSTDLTFCEEGNEAT